MAQGVRLNRGQHHRCYAEVLLLRHLLICERASGCWSVQLWPPLGGPSPCGAVSAVSGESQEGWGVHDTGVGRVWMAQLAQLLATGAKTNVNACRHRCSQRRTLLEHEAACLSQTSEPAGSPISIGIKFGAVHASAA